MRQRTKEIIILCSTILLVISVITVGKITYGNLKKIENQTTRVHEPNEVILGLKLIISELQNAESNVLSYNLYKNEEYLNQYHNSSDQVINYLEALDTTLALDSVNSILLDSVGLYVGQKFQLLNEHLNIRNDEKLLNELNRINNRLDSIRFYDNMRSQKKKNSESKKKGGFLSNLFKGKSKKDTLDRDRLYTDSINALNRKSISKVRDEVGVVKSNQFKQLEDMKERELSLIEEDQHVNGKILLFTSQIEKNENQLLEIIALEDIEQTVKTNNFIKLFGSLILVLMLSLIGYSAYYLYRSGQYRKKLKETARVAQELAKSKEYFLATMSHEIRTPLNSIIGFSEQLMNTSLSGEQKDKASIINTSSNHLLEIVNDVLDFSKIEAGKILLEKIPFNPENQIQLAVTLMKPRADEKNIELIYEKPELPAMLEGDSLRLRQILLNLLSNAIKFTQKGSVTIKTRSETNKEDQTASLYISVTDTGIGISDKQIESIFESFTQADNSITRRFGGTGLGLSITKKLIELQNGEMNISSTPGEGTEISFVIPYALSDHIEKPETNQAKRPPSKKLKGAKVLVADDEAFNRKLILTMAKKHGFVCTEVKNGKEALSAAEKNTFDLILMDIRMPELSGLDTTYYIRKLADKKRAEVPIIALTATASSEGREKCLAAGMNEILTKPYTEKQLIDVMELFVDLTKHPVTKT